MLGRYQIISLYYFFDEELQTIYPALQYQNEKQMITHLELVKDEHYKGGEDINKEFLDNR